MSEQTQTNEEQTKIFVLNKLQIQKIDKIVDDFVPEWDVELQADVWNHFSDKHNIVIVRFDDERYSVRTKNGIEVSPLEIDSKLESIFRLQNQNNHIVRAPKSEGFKSFTTITGMPAAKELENWIKNRKKNDLKGFMNIYNSKSQELKPRQEGMTLDQYQTYLTAVACEFAIMHEGMMELSRKENKKTGALNAEKHKAHQLGLAGKIRKAKNSDSSTPRVKVADLNQTQKLMKTLGLDYSDMVEVKRFEKEQLSQFSSFKINKTSSTETSYGEKKS